MTRVYRNVFCSRGKHSAPVVYFRPKVILLWKFGGEIPPFRGSITWAKYPNKVIKPFSRLVGISTILAMVRTGGSTMNASPTISQVQGFKKKISQSHLCWSTTYQIITYWILKNCMCCVTSGIFLRDHGTIQKCDRRRGLCLGGIHRRHQHSAHSLVNQVQSRVTLFND